MEIISMSARPIIPKSNFKQEGKEKSQETRNAQSWAKIDTYAR